MTSVVVEGDVVVLVENGLDQLFGGGRYHEDLLGPTVCDASRDQPLGDLAPLLHRILVEVVLGDFVSFTDSTLNCRRTDAQFFLESIEKSIDDSLVFFGYDEFGLHPGVRDVSVGEQRGEFGLLIGRPRRQVVEDVRGVRIERVPVGHGGNATPAYDR